MHLRATFGNAIKMLTGGQVDDGVLLLPNQIGHKMQRLRRGAVSIVTEDDTQTEGTAGNLHENWSGSFPNIPVVCGVELLNNLVDRAAKLPHRTASLFVTESGQIS